MPNPSSQTTGLQPKAALACAALAALAFVTCTYGFAPGIMDGDAVVIFNQVLGEPFNDWHPPIFAVLWRTTHSILPGPLGMLIVIQSVYWGGLGLLGAGLARRGYAISGVLVVLAGAYPLALHPTSALLKDTFVAAFFLLSIGLAIFATSLQGRSRTVLFVLAVVALFLGVAFRHNGASAAIPIAALIAVLANMHRQFSWGAVGTAIAAAAVLFGAVQIMNRYAIKARPTSIVDSLYLFDLGGTSYHSGRDTFDGLLGPNFVERNRTECYRPAGGGSYIMGRCREIARRVSQGGERLDNLWRRAIVAEPKAYLRHRIGHFSAAIRWHCPNCFEAGIWRSRARNPSEYRFVPSPLYDLVERSAGPLYRTIGKPYVALAFLFVALVIGWTCRSTLPGQALFAVAGSGILYALSYLVVGAAPAWRYMYWTVVAAVICAPLIVAVILPRRRAALKGVDRVSDRPYAR